ncbi:MAG: hypothetical protein GXY44_09665 [Phycisphaerales bacterium]|nr:hypothetical protein [Phycisphaerales bacterium]
MFPRRSSGLAGKHSAQDIEPRRGGRAIPIPTRGRDNFRIGRATEKGKRISKGISDL